MLIEFRVENHRSLREEQVLTMGPGRKFAREADSRLRQSTGHSDGLLPVAVLYGANASGKSNVLNALAFMREAVHFSHRSWSPDGGIPRDPFAWGTAKASPSLFEVTFVQDEIRYQYGFTASDDRFLEEWLFAWPRGKKQVWFERDDSEFKFGDSFKGENRLIQEVTRSNALFLSAAVQHRHPQLHPVYSWFRRLQTVNVRRRVGYPSIPSNYMLARLLDGELSELESSQPLLFEDESWTAPSLLDRFRTLVRTADFGIIDFSVEHANGDEDNRRSSRPRIVLRHVSQSDEAWLPLEEESHGTQTLFRLALPILRTIESGGILVVDELESSLHPSLASAIVRQFNDRSTNLQNAQLICTTHDTNLLGTTLGKPPLRRDQVWLTEKDAEGGTVLYPLTDYKPRKAENLERGYLQGRYGAIPFLGDFSVVMG